MSAAPGFWNFIRSHPAYAILTAGAVLMGGVGYAQEGYTLWQSGVEAWQLQAGGFALFILAVIILLYRWDRERHVEPVEKLKSPPKEADIKEQKGVTESEQKQQFVASGLYVGELGFGCSKLATDFFMEFWVKGFNATGSEISLFAATGAITYKVKGGEPDAGTLSPPAWLPDRGPTTGSFKDRSEFMFVLEQRVPGALAKAMIKEIESGGKFELGLDALNLMVGPTSLSKRVRLPIWNAVYIGKIEWPSTQRILSLSSFTPIASKH